VACKTFFGLTISYHNPTPNPLGEMGLGEMGGHPLDTIIVLPYLLTLPAV